MNKELFHQEYPPKSWPPNKRWAAKALHRASGGFNFILESLECIHRGGTDAAYSRSVYILMSYHAELVFEAYLLIQDTHLQKKESELISSLKGRHNHDLKELADKIGPAALLALGINNVQSETKNDLKRYVITLDNDKIIIEDLESVRYDFKYDKLRDIDNNESIRMKREVGDLLRITKAIMIMLPK
jgi:hypothetical protein